MNTVPGYDGKGEPTEISNLKGEILKEKGEDILILCTECGSHNHTIQKCMKGRKLCLIPGCGSRTHNSIDHKTPPPERKGKAHPENTPEESHKTKKNRKKHKKRTSLFQKHVPKTVTPILKKS